jgi:RNA polymerase sigma factor (sigma-70 family)
MASDSACIGKTGLGEEIHVVQPAARVIPIFPPLNPEELFIHFYHVYYQDLKTEVVRYTARICVHTEAADDIAQNTFKKLWEKRNLLHLLISPKDFIFTIAKNMILESRRSRLRGNKILQQVAKTKSHYTNETEENISYRDARRVLETRMHRLPPRLRQTYKMKKDGYKLKEIACYMDIREQTVKNFLQKAEKKMGALKEELC